MEQNIGTWLCFAGQALFTPFIWCSECGAVNESGLLLDHCPHCHCRMEI